MAREGNGQPRSLLGSVHRWTGSSFEVFMDQFGMAVCWLGGDWYCSTLTANHAVFVVGRAVLQPWIRQNPPVVAQSSDLWATHSRLAKQARRFATQQGGRERVHARVAGDHAIGWRAPVGCWSSGRRIVDRRHIFVATTRTLTCSRP